MHKYSLAQLAAIYCVYKDLDPITKTISCCTCGRLIHINVPEDSYAYFGHYIPRSKNRNLIYHPKNTHAQCPACNMHTTKEISDSYDHYMMYRYGKNIKNDLMSISKTYTEDEYANYYINLLLQLSNNFPELLSILTNFDTGEVLESQDVRKNNRIENQFYTYSETYKDDLDRLCKILNVKNIEWERM